MVINFSIEAHSNSQVLKDAIDYAISQGVIFVGIAGNFNPSDIISFPGRLPEVITAGATGWTREGLPPDPWFFGDVPENDASQVYVAPFSGREPASVPAGSLIDVLAPGSYVFGEWLFGPGYSEGREVAFDGVDNFIFGTSFAAPHVVGIVARMLEKNPGLTQSQVEAILRSTALPIPPSSTFYVPWDERATGAGLVQGAEAVAATPVPLARVLASGTLASVRVLTRTGSIPAEFRVEGASNRHYTFTLFDVQGRLVRRWVSSTSARTVWDGTRSDGSPAASGVYFVHAEGEGLRASAKLVVAR
jgi:subtilisin family serine protease